MFGCRLEILPTIFEYTFFPNVETIWRHFGALVVKLLEERRSPRSPVRSGVLNLTCSLCMPIILMGKTPRRSLIEIFVM